MNPHEVRGIEAAFEIGDGRVQQIRSRSHVQTHVIAFSADQVDVPRGETHNFVAMGSPEFMSPGRVF